MFNTNEHTDEKGDKGNKGKGWNPDTHEGEHIERMNQQREENEDQRDYEDPLHDKFPDQIEMMWKTNDSCTIRSKEGKGKQEHSWKNQKEQVTPNTGSVKIPMSLATRDENKSNVAQTKNICVRHSGHKYKVWEAREELGSRIGGQTQRPISG